MKRLIVCCDGTWNTPEMPCPTNVVKIAQAIPREDGHGIHQVLFYDDGIGTRNLLDKYAGGALGKGIDLNIMEAYRFLILNYCSGDEIYLYGFSRGAYTVRSLAGVIGFAGMLERHQVEWVKEAYEVYRTHRRGQSDAPAEFRERHGTQVPPITFLGCWDTVEALGLPDKVDFLDLDKIFKDRYRFVNPRLGDHILKAAHAVAIDEIRMEFDVTLMQEAKSVIGRQVREEWFPGDHCCVGGGEESRRPLSDAALKWMMDETRAVSDLEFDLTHISGGLQSDPFIDFDNEPAVIYSRKFRHIPDNAIFHETALARYEGLPGYKESLASDSKILLKAAASARRTV